MASAQPKNASSGSRRRGLVYLIAGAVAIVVVLGVGFAAQSGTAEQASPPAGADEQGSEPAFDMSRRIDGDPTARGDTDAPVVLVEYSDYRCPFCAVFARETLPLLIGEYVDSGQVRIEWRDLTVFGQESIDAAVAGRAAGAQGLFWEFNEATFRDAPERAHLALPRERLLQIGRDIGVPDMARFESDLADPALLAAVTRDTDEARSFGATGTPLFLVNDTPISGAQPVEAFRQAIDRELAEAAE
ncbi:disulfide bond formation protein [Cryobacterium sp. TMT1-21]|uniref:DsbA family protein n=1 Tax=unclassified Cryobacterium TaxID=2649013 RepID=UPI00106A8CE8|nr:MULTISPECIES: thioredoxin domain-containing protein [unclassified Cryobacterium]TFC86898.1 disulfide bond formation protein [Cryobacterium sp. TmT2-59]TFD12021.1 disulfide bond formation protein [Cryobacterium sp. TMT1-21]TFD14642.1 disulfide bond formation protein [Cryobacterium sp. TMT4-10]TFD18539.1 disulfide bond formation protein [Cryobacterium sp. TMT2-23]TFD37987.1 disulfide bond formation protein [Cryobacterium sp. TMT2-10]